MKTKVDLPILGCTLALLVAGLYGSLALEPEKLLAGGLHLSSTGWLLVLVTNLGFWGSLWQLSRVLRARVPNVFARTAITVICVFAFLGTGVYVGGRAAKPLLNAQIESNEGADMEPPPPIEESAEEGPTYAWEEPTYAEDEPTYAEDEPEPPAEETASACGPLKGYERFTPPNHVKAPGEDSLTTYYRLGRMQYGDIILAVSGEDAWVALDSRGKWMDVEPTLLDADICVSGPNISFRGRTAQARYTLDNDRFRRAPAGD